MSDDVFRLRRVYDRIYMLTFEEQYDLAMHFLRYQEFYESGNERFKGNAFRISDYMRWYSLQNDNNFSYPADWSGFNIPSRVIEDVYRAGIPDENAYDITMRAVYETLTQREGDKSWYLIGCVDNAPEIEHELAHGLWFIDRRYALSMCGHIEKLKSENRLIYDTAQEVLIDAGYSKDVVPDELQAYFATGLAGAFDNALDETDLTPIDLELARKPFIDTFLNYIENADLPWVVDRSSQEDIDDES